MNMMQQVGIRSALPFDFPHIKTIAMGFKTSVTLPTIRYNGAARFNGLNDERTEAYRRGVRNFEHANSSNGFPFDLRSNDNQSLFKKEDVLNMRSDTGMSWVKNLEEIGAKLRQLPPAERLSIII
ncbi:MAG: hypothetical protein MUO68_12780 [Desulfobacteraceae bacterium]|nr:hypothetical protein [Desulfobacteraceae bacterium]